MPIHPDEPIRRIVTKAKLTASTETGTAVLIGLASFLLYFRTLAPGVFVSDFAEFQYLPLKLGLAHPNGFPFYMMLGWAWSHIPVGNVAWRMNLLSALGGALAAGATAGFAHSISRNRWVGVLSGGLVALTPTFWGYSLLAERYTLNLFFLVCSTWLVWIAGKRSEEHHLRYLIAASFLIGLGFSTHPSDTLFIPFWLLYAFFRVRELRKNPLIWIVMGIAGVVPLVSFLYVPWRWSHFSGYPIVPGIGRSEAVYRGLVHVWYTPPASWAKEKAYILGLRGAGYGFMEGGWRYALRNLGWLAPTWENEISLGVAAIAAIGFVRLLTYDVPLSTLLAGFALFLTLMVAYIRQGKNDAYLLPVFWVVLFSAGFSIDWILAPLKSEQAKRVARVALALAVVFLLVFIAAGRYPTRDMSRRSDIRRWWLETLNVPIEKDAALLGHWSDFTAFWYLQQIEGVRPYLLGLFPPDEKKVIAPWLESGRPLYLAAPTHGWAEDLGQRYQLIPWGRLVRILPKGAHVDIPFSGGKWYRMDCLSLTVARYPKQIAPESPESVIVRWKAEKDLAKDLFLGIRLEPAQGHYIGFSAPLVIAWLPGSVIKAGTEGFSIVPVRLPVGDPPGKYEVGLRVFHLHGDYMKPFSNVVVPVGEMEVLPTTHFHRSLLGAGEVAPILHPRVGPLTLLSYKLSHQTVRPGDPLEAELVWRVDRRITDDIVIGIRYWGLGQGGMTHPQKLFQRVKSGILQPSTIIRTRHVFHSPKNAGDHTYLAEVRLFADGHRLHWIPTDRWIIGTVRVKDRPHMWALTAAHTPASGRFDDLAELVGYTAPDSVEAGSKLAVKLYWHAVGITDRSYKVFVHLVDAHGKIVAQHDSPPCNGTIPTDIWVKGEYLEDTHEVLLPKALPAGEYFLKVGLYDPSTGARLPVSSDLPSTGNALEIGKVRVNRP
jgi:hypothetical protein